MENRGYDIFAAHSAVDRTNPIQVTRASPANSGKPSTVPNESAHPQCRPQRMVEITPVSAPSSWAPRHPTQRDDVQAAYEAQMQELGPILWPAIRP